MKVPLYFGFDEQTSLKEIINTWGAPIITFLAPTTGFKLLGGGISLVRNIREISLQREKINLLDAMKSNSTVPSSISLVKHYNDKIKSTKKDSSSL